MLSRRVSVFIGQNIRHQWTSQIGLPSCNSTNSSQCSINPPQELLHPIDVPYKLLMGPGPSNCPPRVLAASALPLLGHLHPEFTHIMDEVKAGLQYAFQTENAVTLAISGTGHAGMEAAAVNILEAGDVVLVGSNGLWGQRFASLASRIGADVRLLEKPAGQVFTHEELDQALEEHKPCVFFVTQGESSAGVYQPLEGFGDLCHSHNTLLLVDAVASLGAVPMLADKWGIDVIYSGSQKVLGCPPGSAPISFSPRACDRLASRRAKIPSYYFDMNELANYWGADDQPRRYHHTGPISSIYALREGLAMLSEEGLENSWSRHGQCARTMHKALEDMGLQLYVKDESLRLPTVTSVEVPDGVQWKEVTDFIMKKYRIEISGGLGATAGKVWRIGLMGYNCSEENVTKVVSALDDALTTHRV